MFGKLIGGIIDTAVNTTAKAIQDPIGTVIDMKLGGVRAGLEVLDGLTEGELRLKAAASLGASFVEQASLEQLIEAVKKIDLD